MKLIDLTGLSRFLKNIRDIFATKDDVVWEKGNGDGSVKIKGNHGDAL